MLYLFYILFIFYSQPKQAPTSLDNVLPQNQTFWHPLGKRFTIFFNDNVFKISNFTRQFCFNNPHKINVFFIVIRLIVPSSAFVFYLFYILFIFIVNQSKRKKASTRHCRKIRLFGMLF